MKEILSYLDIKLSEWANVKDRILTEAQILSLGQIAEHNLLDTRLTHNQAQMKVEIHQTLRDALSDIDRMISRGFMGRYSQWNPSQYWGKDVNPFDPAIWKKDFPIERVANFVRCLVNMYGDEYAYGLVKAIEEGLANRTENLNYEVQVRLTKYVKESSFGIR